MARSSKKAKKPGFNVQFKMGEQPSELADYVEAGKIKYSEDGNMTVSTSEGEITAVPGDWIIVRDDGTIFPCKPDIFAKMIKGSHE